jgi:hypothetical protein
MNEKSAFLLEGEPKVLAPSIDVMKALANDKLAEGRGFDGADYPGEIAKRDRFDARADDTIDHRAANGFHFWQLWHEVSISRPAVARQPLTEPDVMPATMNRCAKK